MRLASLKYPNSYRMRAGEHIVQELVIENDGQSRWPDDTGLVFCGSQNQLMVDEVLPIGAAKPH